MSPSSRISAWKVNGPALLCAFEADGASPEEEEGEELLAPCRWTLLHSTIRAVPVEEIWRNLCQAYNLRI